MAEIRSQPSGSLARRLGLGDAVVIGIGSMVGAGVFAAFAPAAAAAGSGLLIGLVLAGFVALCNAGSSAQLAAQYPSSGGAYLYGRKRLGPWSGYLAGWSFIVGKTASSAAMAMTFAAYAVGEDWQRPVAVAAVAALTLINCLGITRTAATARVLVVMALIALAVAVGIGGTQAAASSAESSMEWSATGVLQSAGFLFFAFAGYARIATLGEEVKDPARTIPRAIAMALGIVFVVYFSVGAALIHSLGTDRLAQSLAPIADMAALAEVAWATVVVRIGAIAACLSALLAMMTGIGRTGLAMARAGDLPRWFAVVDPVRHVPRRAEIALGVLVSGLVLTLDLRGAIGFSSFGVLLYYLITNAAAVTQEREHRRVPRAFGVAGAVGCITLVVTLPPDSLIGGLAVVVFGIALRLGGHWIGRRGSRQSGDAAQ